MRSHYHPQEKEMKHLIATSLFALTVSSGLALAAGSSSGGGGTTITPAPTTSPMQMHCKTGYVVKTVTRKGLKPYKICVKATAGIIPDSELYAQGYLLAKTGEYDWALQAFGAMTNIQTPETLTMIGYSNRKAGRLEIAVSYYDQALAMKPDYVKAREYLGEGYVAAGRLDLAKLQLAEIAKRAGTNAEEYIDLSKAITGQTTNL
jgi:tetratricopeptide (TPR) repeat protein